MSLLLVAGTALFSVSVVNSRSVSYVYYVNASTGSDAATGLTGDPFKTITKALSVVFATDSIKVAPGTYNMALGETFPLTMKSGVVLISTGGPLTTIIDAAGANARVIECSGGNSLTVIEGFTITGGNNIGDPSGNFTARGGGIAFESGDMTMVRGNIITGNYVRGYHGLDPAGSGFRSGGNASGSGMYISSSSPTIVNNVISNNTVEGGTGWSYNGGTSTEAYSGGSAQGGGIDATFANAMTIVNNTFYGNIAQGGNGGATNSSSFPTPSGGNGSSGALSAGSDVVVENNIFANNQAYGGNPGSGSGGGSVGTATDGALTSTMAGNLSYNLFFGNVATTNADGGTLGSNTVMMDPLFESTSNFHLQVSSPAKGAGTATGAPATDLDGTTRNNPPSIGAFEGSDPLPVTLVSFVLRSERFAVTLDWSTATEVDNLGFDVERRRVSSGDWQLVGRVRGNGTSSSGHRYSYTDNVDEAGRYAYRIRQIDRGGIAAFSASAEVEVGLAPRNLSLSNPYPNPFNPSTTIEFSVDHDAPATLRLYDMTGKEIAVLFDGLATAGRFLKTTINAARFSSGTYIVLLRSGNSSLHRQIMLVK